MSVFLGNLAFVSGTKFKVNRQLFDPPADYQPTDGPGVLIDSLPDPQPPAGMSVANMYVDKSTKAVTYDYTAVASNGTAQTYDPNDLDSLKQYKISQINTTASEKIAGGFYSYAEGKTGSSGKPVALLYKSDADHREQLSLLNQLVQYHKAGLQTDVKCRWKDASIVGECHEITDACAAQLFAECGLHLLWCKVTSDVLVSQVLQSTAIDAVNAITFPDEPAPTAPTTAK